MNTFITVVLYILWISAIIAILATTFTNFRYDDLNAMAIVLTIFSFINSFFISKKR